MSEIRTLIDLFNALDSESKKYLNYDEFKHLLNIIKLPIVEDYNNGVYYIKDLFNELDKTVLNDKTIINNQIVLSKDVIKNKLENIIEEPILDSILNEKNNINVFIDKLSEYLNI